MTRQQKWLLGMGGAQQQCDREGDHVLGGIARPVSLTDSFHDGGVNGHGEATETQQDHDFRVPANEETRNA